MYRHTKAALTTIDTAATLINPGTRYFTKSLQQKIRNKTCDIKLEMEGTAGVRKEFMNTVTFQLKERS